MVKERLTPEALRRSALFAGLPASALTALLEGAETRALDTGSQLWRAGDRPSSIALVLSGQVKSVWRAGGREVLVDLALQGDVIGDLSFVLDEPLLASSVAIQRARLLLVRREQLRGAFLGAPKALGSALVSMARRAERLQRQVERLSNGGVTERLAATLLGLAERAGAPFPGGILIPVRLRRSDLAALSATRAESVSRHLAEWQRRGMLVLQPAGYLVRDLQALRALAAHARGAKGSGRTVRSGAAVAGGP